MFPADFSTLLQNSFFRYKNILLVVFGLLILVLGGFFFLRSGYLSGTKVEVIGDETPSVNASQITVEIAGEVLHPGVYKLVSGSRIDNLLISSGGFSENADRPWTDKYLNRAAKLIDGQKIYIPARPAGGSHSDEISANKTLGDQTVSSQISSDSNTKVNINTASLSELDKLPGIGPVYAQNIIDHRPYSDVSELTSKGALKNSTYEKIKDLITVY